MSPEQAPAKASPPPGQQNTTGAITVDHRGCLKSFKKTRYEKMVKDKATADFDLRTAEDTIQKQEELMSSKDSEITTLTSEVTEAQNEATALKHQNTTLKTTLQEAMQALKDAGKHSKKEEKKDIKRAISKWIKDVGFRNTKGARSVNPYQKGLKSPKSHGLSTIGLQYNKSLGKWAFRIM